MSRPLADTPQTTEALLLKFGTANDGAVHMLKRRALCTREFNERVRVEFRGWLIHQMTSKSDRILLKQIYALHCSRCGQNLRR